MEKQPKCEEMTHTGLTSQHLISFFHLLFPRFLRRAWVLNSGKSIYGAFLCVHLVATLGVCNQGQHSGFDWVKGAKGANMASKLKDFVIQTWVSISRKGFPNMTDAEHRFERNAKIPAGSLQLVRLFHRLDLFSLRCPGRDQQEALQLRHRNSCSGRPACYFVSISTFSPGHLDPPTHTSTVLSWVCKF